MNVSQRYQRDIDIPRLAKTPHRLYAGEIFRPKNGWKLKGFSRLLAIVIVRLQRANVQKIEWNFPPSTLIVAPVM